MISWTLIIKLLKYVIKKKYAESFYVTSLLFHWFWVFIDLRESLLCEDVTDGVEESADGVVDIRLRLLVGRLRTDLKQLLLFSPSDCQVSDACGSGRCFCIRQLERSTLEMSHCSFFRTKTASLFSKQFEYFYHVIELPVHNKRLFRVQLTRCRHVAVQIEENSSTVIHLLTVSDSVVHDSDSEVCVTSSNQATNETGLGLNFVSEIVHKTLIKFWFLLLSSIN